MQTYPLFAHNVYKFKVDPSRYDKEAIVNKMVRNYSKNPQRNNWDNESILHHTYNDGYNPEFEIVDGSEGLIPLYGEILVNLTKELALQGAVNFNFALANFSINTQYMKKHAHVDGGRAIFATAHYIKFNKDLHFGTTLINPAHQNATYKFVLEKSTKNSCYFNEWEIEVEEDDMIIFPAYLEHYVKNKSDANWEYPRIIASTNIQVI
jgi:hypothetical protein